MDCGHSLNNKASAQRDDDFFFATESQKQCFSRRQAMSKTVLFDLVFLTPRQKVRFGPRTQNDDFLGTRPWARAKKTHRFSSSVRNYYFGGKNTFIS